MLMIHGLHCNKGKTSETMHMHICLMWQCQPWSLLTVCMWFEATHKFVSHDLPPGKKAGHWYLPYRAERCLTKDKRSKIAHARQADQLPSCIAHDGGDENHQVVFVLSLPASHTNSTQHNHHVNAHEASLISW